MLKWMQSNPYFSPEFFTSPFKKTFLMILSLMFVFSLFACRPEEESEYSLSMRNASESRSFQIENWLRTELEKYLSRK